MRYEFGGLNLEGLYMEGLIFGILRFLSNTFLPGVMKTRLANIL